MKTQLINNHLLDKFENKQRFTLLKHLNDLAKKQNESFAFVRSSVFSWMIEGSSIDLDNYLFNKESEYQNKEMNQIDDLISAYKFARTHVINEKNVIEAYKIMSQNLSLAEEFKGKIRNREVKIRTWTGSTVYEGCRVEYLNDELTKFFFDIEQLKSRARYTYNEAFYYAAYAHLVFVNIHPFADGNGRMSRLIEKWVLATLLQNQHAWKIPSEINYWIRREKMHLNLNKLGSSYAALDYSKSLPFLLMLPSSFGITNKFMR
jgi:Fic family protein